ncbi:hypothetical protein CC80DRAFT_416963 [Byssothecium circinans]|uniref:RING-type domain-containing protein n=1 Tax=Byssothecium circinans TaxID=147558 RepID=A0A6A5TPW4_9PLEO|nr:hypothetical protein CC80DRAFT_416963 [Byssothecium circinans]
MEALINNELKPTESCIICTESFSDAHLPVALRCRHIIGQECIKNWLLKGRGNTNSCPFCRHAIIENISPPQAFNDTSIWHALCEQPPTRLHTFMTHLWTGVTKLCKDRSPDNSSVSSILEEAIFPALTAMSDRRSGPFLDCHSLVSASWNSLGRPNQAQGSLAIPLVRLVRLMSQLSSVIPKWLTGLERISTLFWRANACLPLTAPNAGWQHLQEAAQLTNTRYFSLLHLYTVVVSQTLVHLEQPKQWPEKRHEVMNLVVERCCRRIGGEWEGKPGNRFKDVLVGVYEEMRRWQGELGHMSLRGHEGEEVVVRGFWGMAAWGKEGVGKL